LSGAGVPFMGSNEMKSVAAFASFQMASLNSPSIIIVSFV